MVVDGHSGIVSNMTDEIDNVRESLIKLKMSKKNLQRQLDGLVEQSSRQQSILASLEKFNALLDSKLGPEARQNSGFSV